MILRCTIAYTTPDGQAFCAGELYSVEPELGLWLLSAAAGQFAVEEDNAAGDETQDVASVQSPPADRQVGRPPLGGAPRSKKR